MAITLGFLLGILPKENLLFLALGLLCYLLPSHLPLLALCAIATSFATPLLESTVGRIGLWSLTHPQLSAFWLQIDSLPLVPWLGIHNTVVHGTLMLWCTAVLPVYFLSKLASSILMSGDLPVVQSSQSSSCLAATNKKQVVATEHPHDIQPIVGVREPGQTEPIALPVFVLQRRESDSLSAIEVVSQAADIAAWAEDLIADELQNDSQEMTATATSSSDVSTGTHHVEDRWLLETTMEVVRIAEQAVTNQAAMKSKSSGDGNDLQSESEGTTEIHTAPVTQHSTAIQQPVSGLNLPFTHSNAKQNSSLPESSIRREQTSHASQRSHLDNASAGVASNAVNRPREEALHYLLRHLKGIQEKAEKQC